MSSHSGCSSGPPKSHTALPSPAQRAATSAKCLAGQRLAGPKAAPGQSATTGLPAGRSSRARAAARFSGSARSSGVPARSTRQRRVAFDQAGQTIGLEAPCIVQHGVTMLPKPARPPRDAREPRHQRGLERVGQDEGPFEAVRAERPPDPQAFSQPQPSMTDPEPMHGVDPRHPLRHRGRRKGGEHVDDGAGVGERRDQGLRQDHVADPGRPDDERLHGKPADARAAATGPAYATPDAPRAGRGPDRSSATAAAR